MSIDKAEVAYDEIDLYKLYQVIKKRRLIILSCILFSFAITTIYLIVSPKVYKLSNIISLDPVVSFGANDLLIVLADDDLLFKLKSQELNLDRKVLDKIVEIKISPCKKKNLLNERALMVDIMTLDLKAGKALMEFLPEYILASPFILNKIEDQKTMVQKNLEAMKLFKDESLSALHSSKDLVLIGSEVYSMYERYNQYLFAIDKLNNNQFITLVGDTLMPHEPYKPKKLQISLLGLFMGLFIGIFMAFFLEWIDNSNVENKSELKNASSL